MRVFLTGASGQIGYDVARKMGQLGIEFIGVSSKDLDVTNRYAVLQRISHYKPDALIHCAAYTAVDKAEDEPEKCWAVNVDGTRNVAEACRLVDAKMLYLSTDYVFDGRKTSAYEINDIPKPLNEYGKSKYAAECVIQELLERFYIVRTSWAVGVKGKNFLKTILHLSETHHTVTVVGDQIGSPTFTADLAPLLCNMVLTEKYGIYHATNEGICSWAVFANAILRCAGKSTVVNFIRSEDYHSKAIRPKNSILSKRSLDENGFQRLPHWETSLRHYLDEMTGYIDE